MFFVNNLVEYRKRRLGSLERMGRSYSHTLVFSINPKEDVMLEDVGKDGNTKNILSFKGRGLKT
jgi:hypothetical protein